MRVILGSSIPHFSSSTLLRGRSPRVWSISHPVSPLSLVATTREERPLRCSTLSKSRVLPLTSVAPGLKTALTVLGKSAARRIGFPAKRWEISRFSSRWLIGIHLFGSVTFYTLSPTLGATALNQFFEVSGGS